MKDSWKNNKNSWGLISVIIHWITAVVIIGLFAIGLWMTSLDYYSSWYKTAPFIHKSIGVLLFILTIFRLVWRIVNNDPKSINTHSKFERVMGKLMHILLYVLIFSIIISGYMISTADGRPISVFGWFEIPALITSINKQEDIAGTIHFYLACIIIAMASIHGVAAIKHHFIDKDKTLIRMFGKS